MSIRAIRWAQEVLPQIDVPPTERTVLLCLACHHNDKTGECFPSMETLGRLAGVTPRRVQQAVAALVAWGLIKKRRGATAQGNASNRYTLFGRATKPDQAGKGVPVQRPLKPEQKYRFETGTPLPVSNRNTVSDDRGSGSDSEDALSSGAKFQVIAGASDA